MKGSSGKMQKGKHRSILRATYVKFAENTMNLRSLFQDANPAEEDFLVLSQKLDVNKAY